MDQSSKGKIEKLKEERAMLLARRDRVRTILPVSPVAEPETTTTSPGVERNVEADKIEATLKKLEETTKNTARELEKNEKELSDIKTSFIKQKINALLKNTELVPNFKKKDEKITLSIKLKNVAGADFNAELNLEKKEGSLTITGSNMGAKFPKEVIENVSEILKMDLDSKTKQKKEKLIQEQAELKKNLAELAAATDRLKKAVASAKPTSTPPTNQENLDTSTKKEGTPTPKTPEEVRDFIAEFGLESLLPPSFKSLPELIQLKVIGDLKRRIVDIVKSDARTQYSEELKGKSLIISIASSVTKERDVKNLEKKVFEELRNTPEGKKLIAEDLEMLTKMTERKDIRVSKDGSVYVSYLNPADLENPTPEKRKAVEEFNIKANTFANIPYEWGQEKKGAAFKMEREDKKGLKIKIGSTNRAEYEIAKAEYEKARDEILKIKEGGEDPEDKGRAMLEILEIDNALQMEQILNTHPEFEKALEDFGQSAGGKEMVKTAGNFFETITGGKNLTNKLLFAGGYGARMGVRVASAASSMTVLGALGASAIGGVIGGLRARFRAKNTLEERKKQARHGQEDKNKEATNTVNAENLNERLTTMIGAWAKTAYNGDALENIKRTDQIKRRIEYTQNKIENGLVNFGDAKTALKNQFDLINNLNRALAISSSFLEEKTRKDIDERLEKFLSYKTKNINEAQKKFIYSQMRRGAIMGAGFATVGYTLRYVGEHLGWWGHHGAETVATEAKTTQPGSLFRIESSHPPTNITPAINNFTGESIKFEHGKGGIQGILDLKNQMRAHYNNDFSKAPESIQKFMADHDVTRQAIKLGLFDPSHPNESALIGEGSVLKFDEHGNLLFGKPDASGNIPILEKYHGAMFHSGSHETIADTGPGTKTTPGTPTLEENLHAPTTIDSEDDVPWVNTPDDTTEGPATADELRAKIAEQLDTAKEPPALDHAGSENIITHTPNASEFARFVNNPFHLSGTKLIQAFDASQRNIKFLFGEKPIYLMNVGAKELIHADLANSDLEPARLGECLRQLEFFSRLKPKGSGLLGIGKAETAEEYMARAFQKLVKNGGLKLFEENMRDIRK